MHNVPSKKKKIKPPPPTTKKTTPPTHPQKTSTTTKPPTNPKKNPKKPHPKNIKMQSLVSLKVYVGSTPQQVLHVLSLSPLYKSDLEGNFKKTGWAHSGQFFTVFQWFLFPSSGENSQIDAHTSQAWPSPFVPPLSCDCGTLTLPLTSTELPNRFLHTQPWNYNLNRKLSQNEIPLRPSKNVSINSTDRGGFFSLFAWLDFCCSPLVNKLLSIVAQNHWREFCWGGGWVSRVLTTLQPTPNPVQGEQGCELCALLRQKCFGRALLCILCILKCIKIVKVAG